MASSLACRIVVKVLTVQPFHLQRSEQRLRAGVVPAVALAAHRGCDPVLFKRLRELARLAYWLPRSLWKDQLRFLCRTALQPSHLQSIDHQLASHVGTQRPAHHPAAEQIDHHGQKQPAFLGCNVGDVACPHLVGCGHGEVAVQTGSAQSATRAGYRWS